MNNTKIKRKFPHEKNVFVGTFTRIDKKRAFYKGINTIRLRICLIVPHVFGFVNMAHDYRLLPNFVFLNFNCKFKAF